MKSIYRILFYSISIGSFVSLLGKNEKKMEKDKHVQIITSTHVRAFSRDNLFNKRIETEDFNSWESALKEVKKYVEKNEPKGMTRKKQDYSQIVRTLSDISDTMINSLKVGYNQYVSMFNANSGVTFEQQRKRLVRFVEEQLEAAKARSKQIRQSLEEKREALKNKTTKERYVVDVVYTLSLTIEATIDKIISDAKKLPKAAFIRK